MALEGITPVTIERWLAEMRGKGLSDSYLKRMMATLKAILNDAIRAGALTDNAATKVSKLRDQARQRVLSDDEITLLLDTAKTEEVWMYNAILWALHSGMRRGEILALTWNNVHQMSDGVEFVTLENTKSGRPRNVTCTEQMSVVLSAQRKVAVKGDNRVWPVSEMTFRRRWEDIRKKAGLSESIVFHDLRRTNATVAASQGVDVRTLADRMGHTDLKMMGKHYAHRVDSAERRAATQINEAFKTMGKPSAKRESPLSKQLGEAHIS